MVIIGSAANSAGSTTGLTGSGVSSNKAAAAVSRAGAGAVVFSTGATVRSGSVCAR
ncbi:hypothetical protein [Neisseria dentiae]|uniref:hypothetical protein n=1 Tax=Neisseria dentiae TaxID=194197 RepID=UPI00359F8944